MSVVRGPKDDEERERFLRFIANGGGGTSLEEVLVTKLGGSYDDLLLIAANMAIENAIQEGEPIDINMMIERHLEWQEANA
jgi:hypothetical protein